MFTDVDTSQIERWIEDQTRLAAFAKADEIRAMHLELAALYRSQLVCILASQQLNSPPLHAMMAQAA